MKTIFMNTRNSKTNETHGFVFNLPQKLLIRSLDKRVALQNLFTYYTWKNVRKQYKNNKFKIIAPTLNDKFELPDGSYSVTDIQNLTNTSLRSTKFEEAQIMFTLIELIIE